MKRCYNIGDWFINDRIFAIPCKDVKDIEEARNFVLSIRRVWQEEFTDEEYKQKFGRDKVVILNEKIAHIRKVGNWKCSGYEYKEWDWISYWKITEKLGRGAMKCYIFECQDDWSEYNKYLMEKEVKQDERLD